MKPSLTPHEDAVRAIFEKSTEPADPFYAAALRCIRPHQLECARLLDQGQNSDAVFALTSSVATSIIDSIASSAATGQDNPAAARVYFINHMLAGIARRLAENRPDSSDEADIRHADVEGHA